MSFWIRIGRFIITDRGLYRFRRHRSRGPRAVPAGGQDKALNLGKPPNYWWQLDEIWERRPKKPEPPPASEPESVSSPRS